MRRYRGKFARPAGLPSGGRPVRRSACPWRCYGLHTSPAGRLPAWQQNCPIFIARRSRRVGEACRGPVLRVARRSNAPSRGRSGVAPGDHLCDGADRPSATPVTRRAPDKRCVFSGDAKVARVRIPVDTQLHVAMPAHELRSHRSLQSWRVPGRLRSRRSGAFRFSIQAQSR